jgi:hypothetical protein
MVKLQEECSAAILNKKTPGALWSAALSGSNTLRMHYATLEPALSSCLR